MCCCEILQLTRLCLLLACTSDRTRGPCSEWDGLSTTVKRRCGGRERSKDQPTDEENPSWTRDRPLRPSGPSSKATVSDQTLQARGCELQFGVHSWISGIRKSGRDCWLKQILTQTLNKSPALNAYRLASRVTYGLTTQHPSKPPIPVVTGAVSAQPGYFGRRPCCYCPRHLRTLYIHYIPAGKYLMGETFVNACAWLGRIDYWWLSKTHCIPKQHWACDILKPVHRLCNISEEDHGEPCRGRRCFSSSEQRGLYGFLPLLAIIQIDFSLGCICLSGQLAKSLSKDGPSLWGRSLADRLNMQPSKCIMTHFSCSWPHF